MTDGMRKVKKSKKEKQKIQFSVSNLPESFFEMNDAEQEEWARNYFKRVFEASRSKDSGPRGD